MSLDLRSLARLYDFQTADLHPNPHGGNYHRSYRFARDGESFILRVSPPDESPYVLESSMNYLAEHFSLGSPVVEPVRSINGRLVEEGVSTEGERHLVTVTRVAPGRTHESLARDTISDDLFFEIGRSLAVLHCNLMLIDGRSYGFPEQSRFATLTTPAKGSLPWTRRWSCLTSA